MKNLQGMYMYSIELLLAYYMYMCIMAYDS